MKIYFGDDDAIYDVIIKNQFEIDVITTDIKSSVLRSAKRAPANIRRLNNISGVIFYCSRALALLNAALVSIRWINILLDISKHFHF